MSQRTKHVIVGLCISALVIAILFFGGATESRYFARSVLWAALAGWFSYWLLEWRASSKRPAERRLEALTLDRELSKQAESTTHATLYLVRVGPAQKFFPVLVSLDGTLVARLFSPRFTVMLVAPGRRTIHAALDSQFNERLGDSPDRFTGTDLPIEAVAGDIVVVGVRVMVKQSRTTVLCERSSIEVMRESLSRLRMSEPEINTV